LSKKPKSSLLSTLGQYNDPPETLKDRPFYDMVLDPEQEAFRDAIWDRNKLAVICNAKAGVGKTTIALGVALLLYQYQRYDGIVYIISPTMEQKQGFIPGGPEDKNAPYQQPLCEALITLGVDPKQAIMSDDNLQAMKEGRAFIQFISDTYLRGTNFENKIVIIDEAQNFYFNDLQKDLTRIHDSCKTIIIGHDKQCDIIKHPERSGFIPYLKAFSSIKGKDAEKIAICELRTNHRGWFSTFCDNIDIEGNILKY
jgi:predicted ribonuclease YlaK